MAVATRPTERTRFFKSSPRALLINGKFEQAESGKTFDTLNPASGEVLASVAEGARQKDSVPPTTDPPIRHWFPGGLAKTRDIRSFRFGRGANAPLDFSGVR